MVSYQNLAEDMASPKAVDQIAERLREVSASREKFITAAVDGFRVLMERQYPTLRAFEMMAGKTELRLTIDAEFEFHPKRRAVRLVARAIPQPIAENVSVAIPAE